MSPFALAAPASRCAVDAASPFSACAPALVRPVWRAPSPRAQPARRHPARPAAQVGEPSNKGRPASPGPTAGAPAPKDGGGGADEEEAAADAAAAATEYAEGVARVAEEGMSSAGDVAYAARADAIAAERKVRWREK